MRIPDILLTLKDGREVVIRNPRLDEAEKILEVQKTMSLESPYTGRSREDWNGHTVEWQWNYIRKMNDSPNAVMLVCVTEGYIAGVCKLWREERSRERHRCGITIAIRKPQWGLGIGTKMFEEMINVAQQWDGVRQMELYVTQSNTRAMRLYRKMGFECVGVHPNALLWEDGSLHDQYLMTRRL